MAAMSLRSKSASTTIGRRSGAGSPVGAGVGDVSAVASQAASTSPSSRSRTRPVRCGTASSWAQDAPMTSRGGYDGVSTLFAGSFTFDTPTVMPLPPSPTISSATR